MMIHNLSNCISGQKNWVSPYLLESSITPQPRTQRRHLVQDLITAHQRLPKKIIFPLPLFTRVAYVLVERRSSSISVTGWIISKQLLENSISLRRKRDAPKLLSVSWLLLSSFVLPISVHVFEYRKTPLIPLPIKSICWKQASETTRSLTIKMKTLSNPKDVKVRMNSLTHPELLDWIPIFRHIWWITPRSVFERLCPNV